MEYAEVPDAHEEAYDRILSYAFAPERGPTPDRDGPDDPESFQPRGAYGEFTGSSANEREAENLLAVCGYYEFSARIRGGFHSLGGVSAVASPPEHRRRGVVRDMLAELHAEFRGEDITFAALWPFEHAFYRRFGYARVNDYVRLTVPPEELEGAIPAPEGEFVTLSGDDWKRLDAVYTTAATEPLALDRTEGWWRCRVFQSWGTEPFVYGWERDGELRGYVVYSVTGDGDGNEDGKTFQTSELVGVDEKARGHLLRFCRNHDSQVERIRLTGNPEMRLFDRLTDPRTVETVVRPGPMFRLVDVSAGLEALAYASAVDGTVVIDVDDGHCEWNDESFRLRIADGTATCEPTSADPDVTLGVGALSRLVVGSHSVSRLEQLGDVVIESARDRELLTSAFPETDPYLREGF